MTELEVVAWREIVEDHRRLATWNSGRDRPKRVAFHHDAAITIERMAKALAPAQAEMERLETDNDLARSEARRLAASLAVERQRALAAEEQVRVLSKEHASIVAMMRRWIKMIDDPKRQENGLSESLLLGIRRGASQAVAALQHKDNQDGT